MKCKAAVVFTFFCVISFSQTTTPNHSENDDVLFHEQVNQLREVIEVLTIRINTLESKDVADSSDVNRLNIRINQLETRIEELKNRLRNNNVPVGTIAAFAGEFTVDIIRSLREQGWLPCDGRAVPQDTSLENFFELRRILNNNFGTDKLPDLTGRVPLGSGNRSGLSSRRIGQMFGAETHTLENSEIAPHEHSVKFTDPITQTATIFLHDGSFNRYLFSSGGGHITDFRLTDLSIKAHSDNVEETQPHNNMQPSLVVNFIIKAK